MNSSYINRLIFHYKTSGITITDVILTESRVFFLYIFMVIAPLADQLLLLQPLVISKSIFNPFITFFACLGIIGALLAILYTAKKWPIVSFGIAFFLITLLPESLTVPQYLFFGYRPIIAMPGMMLMLFFVLLALFSQLRQVAARTALGSVLVLLLTYLEA